MFKPKHRILPPAAELRSGRTPPGVTSRAVVVGGGQLRAGVRDALFVHIGGGNTATGASAPFITQHLDQEWVRRKPHIDPRRGNSAYRRAGNIPVQRLDLLPPI